MISNDKLYQKTNKIKAENTNENIRVNRLFISIGEKIILKFTFFPRISSSLKEKNVFRLLSGHFGRAKYIAFDIFLRSKESLFFGK